MSNKDFSKNVLNTVKKKTGKSVSEKDIQDIASGVNSSTVKSEAQLRQLINQVASLVNVQVSEDTIKEIIHAVKSSNLDSSNISQLMSVLTKK
jgi:uncharacterized protein YpuA (DUF1002 family)